jgi:hypothetical protein
MIELTAVKSGALSSQTKSTVASNFFSITFLRTQSNTAILGVSLTESNHSNSDNDGLAAVGGTAEGVGDGVGTGDGVNNPPPCCLRSIQFQL